MDDLITLHEAIDSRVQSIRNGVADWPCAKGCDACCHRLAEIPSLTGAEWEMLKAGVQQWSWEPFGGLSIGMVSLEFAAGWMVSSVVLGSLCYGLVQLGWRMGQFLHSRKKSGKL